MKTPLALLALALTGCAFEALSLGGIAAPDAGGCGTSAAESDAAVGCYNPHESPAAVTARVVDPYPAALPMPLPPPLAGPGPQYVSPEGIVITADRWTWLPALPLAVAVDARDTCRPTADCAHAIGEVSWRWGALIPELFHAAGLYPYPAQMIATCRVLPRPLCDDAAARYTQGVDAAMTAAGYHRVEAATGAGWIPQLGGDRAACTATDCQIRLGRSINALCQTVNVWTHDRDGDGAGDTCDRCPADFEAAQRDTDGDGRGDLCDPCPQLSTRRTDADDDRDGVLDCDDNCRLDANPDQADLDDDGEGDACDDDQDGDGVDRATEEAQGTDDRDPDSDDDGHDDGADTCPTEPNPEQADSDGDGVGNACRLPLLPPVAVVPRGVRFDELFLGDIIEMPGTDRESWTDGDVMEAVYRLVDEGRAAGASWYDDREPVLAQAQQGEDGEGGEMDIPEPDVPAERERKPNSVGKTVMEVAGDVADAIEVAEDAERHVLDIVRGVNYERWAMGNYCFSLPHNDAEQPCRRERRITRWERRPEFYGPGRSFWTHPQPVNAVTAGGVPYVRHRRHDCHCPAVPERGLPPLSLEAKSTSRPAHPRYSQSYERHLVEQCRDYRFALAKLYHEAFPEAGADIRETYRRLLAVGGDPPTADPPGVAADRRPVLQYLLSDASPALQRVMERCTVDDVRGDIGLQPTDGGWWPSQTHAGRSIPSVATDLRTDPPQPVSAMRWKAIRPGRTNLPDAVRNCDGRITYVVKRAVRTANDAPKGYTYTTPELWTLCDGNPAHGAQWNADNLVTWQNDWHNNRPRGDVLWGDVEFPILDGPVCPPETINDDVRAIHERLVESDGVGRLSLAGWLWDAAADGDMPDFWRHRTTLALALGALDAKADLVRVAQLGSANLCYIRSELVCALNPLCRWHPARDRCEPDPGAYDRLRYPRAIGTLDWVLPGYWVALSEGPWHHYYQDTMTIPYHDPITDHVGPVVADRDERRDMCFD